MSKKRNRLPVIGNLDMAAKLWAAKDEEDRARRERERVAWEEAVAEKERAIKRAALQKAEAERAWKESAARLQFCMEKIIPLPPPVTRYFPAFGYGLVLGPHHVEHIPGPGVPPPPGGRGTGGKTIGGGLRGDYLLTDDG